MKCVSVIIDRPTKSLDTAFTYSVPKHLLESANVGVCVSVDFNNCLCIGFIVEDLGDHSPTDFEFKVNTINDVLSESYFSPEQAKLALWIAEKYVSEYSTSIKLFLPVGGTPKLVRHKTGEVELAYANIRPKQVKFCADEVASFASYYEKPNELTREQVKALSVIDKAILDGGKTVLIDGVTGSGKTEIYLQIIEKVLSSGRNAIVLVPEISLTPQTVARFSSRFGDEVAVLHSKMTPAQRRSQWFYIKDGGARVVIGPRSALFAPLENVGIVVIDEEHEASYKQESSPRYNAKDVAIEMMKRQAGTVVLGSATPSLKSLYLAKNSPDWASVRLSERPGGARMPKVEVVDMRREYKSGRKSMFSSALRSAIIEELRADNKVVLLLNQRGFASHLTCLECGFVPECPNCAISLTYHEKGNLLKCHHCGYEVGYPGGCPKCNSVYLSRTGGGTERVELELSALLNEAGLSKTKLLRMDADTTKKATDYKSILEQFGARGASVLLGTQMIAKGLDVADVTLVGVINADTTMHVPDYTATERTYDLVEQVSGRAGRKDKEGRVIIQTLQPDNAALRAATVHERKLFLAVEVPKREILKYPPYVGLVNIIVSGKDATYVEDYTKSMQRKLQDNFNQEIAQGLEVLPANKCTYERLNGKTRYHILVKVPLELDITDKLNAYFRNLHAKHDTNIIVDVDPETVM